MLKSGIFSASILSGYFLADKKISQFILSETANGTKLDKLDTAIQAHAQFPQLLDNSIYTKSTKIDYCKFLEDKTISKSVINRINAQGHAAITHGGYVYTQLFNFGKLYSEKVLNQPLKYEKTRIRYKKPTKAGGIYKIEARFIEDLSTMHEIEADNFTSAIRST